MKTVLRIDVPAQFHFRNTLLSHGWCGLEPFTLHRSPLRLETWLRSGGRVFHVTSSFDRRQRRIELETDPAPTAKQETGLRRQARSVFNLDLDLHSFYALARTVGGFEWISRRRAGRMLRAPTVFEDVVKMILTTNCTWSLTTMMCRNLVRFCGSRESGGVSFPEPAEISSHSERYLRETVRLGYRAPFIRELAHRVSRGELDLERLRVSSHASEILYRRFRDIKGVGEYAAGNLLKLLGRFDRLGLDSWCRSRFASLYGEGTRPTDAAIAERYRIFGPWKGLALWLDLTKEWYDNKFPEL